MNTEFITRLEAAVDERQPRREGREIKFLCPGHNDRNPSAAWNPQQHVWHCFTCGAGGGAYDLAKRLGVELPMASPTGLTLQEFADYVALPLDFFRSVGLAEGVVGTARTKCVDIPYTTGNGDLAAVRKRLRISGEPRMIWRRGDHPLPYGLARLDEARTAGEALVLEGETDSLTSWFVGVPALGLPGAGTWKGEWAKYLDGIEKVYVWREPDQGGDTLTGKIRLADLPNIFVITPPPGLKDLSSLWHACEHDRDGFLRRLRALQAAARPASQLRQEAFSAEARKLSERIGGLLNDRDLIGKITNAIKSLGYVGNTNPPMTAYIALTSRLLPRPLNLAFVAPSGAGKNAAVDAAVALMPAEAYYLEKAGSARALIYSDEPLEHRTVIVAEADSIPQDEGPAASAIRSLAEDGFMTYDVVQTDPQSGNFKTRRILKQGPTGLITTSTKPLHEQLSTRMLTCSISDSPSQTRAVLGSQAAAVNGLRPHIDTSQLIDLQRWLALAGDHEVMVPFSHALAELVPVDHVRMRRDFRQLLTVIQAVALLYQCQRGRDEAGRVVATMDDYSIARSLILDTFTTAATAGITKEIREVAAKVAELYTPTRAPQTRQQVADALGVVPRTMGYRLTRALSLGYVVNREERPRQPGKYVPGDPLPDEQSALPTLEELAAYMCEANAADDCHAATVEADSPIADTESHQKGVANTVASLFATPFATVNEADTDSQSGTSDLAWQRGNVKRDERYTSTQLTPCFQCDALIDADLCETCDAAVPR